MITANACVAASTICDIETSLWGWTLPDGIETNLEIGRQRCVARYETTSFPGGESQSLAGGGPSLLPLLIPRVAIGADPLGGPRVTRHG